MFVCHFVDLDLRVENQETIKSGHIDLEMENFAIFSPASH